MREKERGRDGAYGVGGWLSLSLSPLSPFLPPHARPLSLSFFQLRYYMYNWRVTPELKPGQVGLVML